MRYAPGDLERRRQELEERRRQRRRRRRRQAVVASLVVVAALAMAAVGFYFAYQRGMRSLGMSDSAAGASTGVSRRVTMLLVGTDSTGRGSGRTDTIMVASFDPRTGEAGIMSIPRDTRVQIPGRSGFHRINTAYALGGPELTVRTVEALLGVNIDHVVVVDFDSFARFIDLLGGVQIHVDQPMRYDDFAQGLHIDIRPGPQVLTGEQALHYVRFRDALGDVALIDPARDVYGGRVRRQLEFVRAVVEQAMQLDVVPKLPQLVPELLTMVETDLSLDRALALALSARRLDLDRLKTEVLPGTGRWIGGASYWVHDPVRTDIVVRKIILGETVTTLEVLNGGGSAGMAGRAADLLRRSGYDVVRTGNAPGGFRYERTQIIVNRPGVAVEPLVRLLGGQVSYAGQDPSETGADVTVILGRDFRG
ncbi:MAG: LCP family protein [Firmicutes bacterium]|nr:LCP family protein [Bacillota bacterium]